MRQSGRHLPQFRDILARYGFPAMCKVPDLIAQVTLLPVNTLAVDAAQAFSDILTTVEPMGMRLEYRDDGSPHFDSPVRSAADVERLRVPEPDESLAFRMEAIRIIRRELAGRIPLLGFAGGPFTVAAYMIEGGPSARFAMTRQMMFQAPQVFHALMDKVTRLTCRYIVSQARAGAQAVTLFDTWAGILPECDYTSFVLPYVKQAVEAMRPTGAPVMYYVSNCAGLIERIIESGTDVLDIDSRISLDRAISRVAGKASVQGNLDPHALLLPREELVQRVKGILAAGRRAKGHIFNLGDGLFPGAPLDSIKLVVDTVHEFGRNMES